MTKNSGHVRRTSLDAYLSRDFAFMTVSTSAQVQPVFYGITAVPGRGQYIDAGVLLIFFRLMDKFQGRLFYALSNILHWSVIVASQNTTRGRLHEQLPRRVVRQRLPKGGMTLQDGGFRWRR